MRLVIDIFDHHAAYVERQSRGAFVSKSAISGHDPSSLDTYTGLPYELEQEVLERYHSLQRPLRLPRDLWEDLSAAGQFPLAPSSLSQQRSLNVNAPVFTPGGTTTSNTGASAPSPTTLRSRKQTISATIQPVFSPLRSLDWRFGLIQVDYFERPALMQSRSNSNSNAAIASPSPTAAMSRSPLSLSRSLELPPMFERRGRSNTEYSATSDSPTLTVNRASDAGTIDLGYGIMHLYKEEDKDGNADETHQQDSTTKTNEAGKMEGGGQVLEKKQQEGTMVAVLAVPANWATSDFLEFISVAVESIEQMRTMKDALPNRYMVLIRFKTSEEASLFQEMFDTKPYSAMLIDEICHVVRITSVEIKSSGNAPYTFAFPQHGPEFDGSSSSTSSASNTKKETGLLELPTCPVCLERMDASVSGLITVQCSHTFHCMCLRGWSNNNCPVCRYTQGRNKRDPCFGGAGRPSSCAICAATESLWMCLICGHVGCGRFSGRHAQAHYNETGHTFAFEIESQRVWDYAGDQYVHRLIQSKTDGKLVELPSSSGTPGHKAGPHGAAGDEIAKIEAISIEFSDLLSTQLDSQRSYYAEKVQALKEELQSTQGKKELARTEARRLHEQLAKTRLEALERENKRKEIEASLTEKVRVLEEEIVPGLERDRARIEKKLEKATELARTLHRDLDSERSVSRGLLDNLGKLKEENEKRKSETDGLQAQIKDLNEQLQDLMFTLSAQAQLAQSEAAGGDLVIGQSSTPTKSPASARRKKR